MADFHNDTEVARRIATQKRKRILAMRHNTAIVVVTKCTDENQLKREIACFFRNVERLARYRGISPVHRAAITTLNHDRHQPVNILAAKGWLYHRARTAPYIAVADNQAIAKQHLHALETRSFFVLGIPSRQDFPNFDSIVHKVGRSAVWLIE